MNNKLKMGQEESSKSKKYQILIYYYLLNDFISLL